MEVNRDSPISMRYSWLSGEASRLGFGSLFDCILTKTRADIDYANSLERGNKYKTGANAAVVMGGRDFVDFMGSMLEIKDEQFRSAVVVKEQRLAIAVVGILRKYLISETRDLAKAFSKPYTTYLRRDIGDFTFEEVIAKEAANAPVLWGLFRDVFALGNSSRMGKEDTSTDIGEDEGSENDSADEDEFDTGLSPIPIQRANEAKKKKKAQRKSNNKELIASMGLAVCCYAFSQEANFMQGAMGYFLYSSGAGRRVIAVMQRVGVSPSYSSITNMCFSIAASCKADYSAFAQSRPFLLVADNLDYYIHVRQQVMNRLGFQENRIASYVLFPDVANGESPPYKFLDRRVCINRDAAMDLESRDLLLKHEDFVHFKETSKVHFYRILSKHFKPEMRTMREFVSDDGKILLNPPPTIKEVYKIGLKTSKLFTLPVIDLNETKIEELMRALTIMIEELGQSDKGLDFMIALVSGDYLTVRNIVAGLYELQDTPTAKERLDFLEPFIGLFHLQMNILKVLMTNFWEPLFREYLIKMQNNKAKKDATKDFRATNFFFNDVVDGTLLAAFAQHPTVRTSGTKLEDLRAYIEKAGTDRRDEIKREASLKTRKKKGDPATEQIEVDPDFDWEQVVREIVDDVFNVQALNSARYDDSGNPIPARGKYKDDTSTTKEMSGQVPESMNDVRNRNQRARVEDEDEIDDHQGQGDKTNENPFDSTREFINRDIVLENNILLCREGLVYREYEDAVKSGDSGRIEKVIRYWCVMYQGTKLSNYPREMVHLVACLLKIWGEDIREIFMNNCLVNMIGKPGAWLPLDLFCEYVVRELKARKNPTSNQIQGKHWEETLARQIMTQLASRQGMYHTTNATTGGTRTTLANSRPNVSLVYQSVMEANGFTYTSDPRGRYLGSKTDSGKDDCLIPMAVDFYSHGLRRIISGEVLREYRKGARCNWRKGESFGPDDGEDFEDITAPLSGGSGLAGGALDDD